MTKKEKIEKSNKIKAVTYYCIAKGLEFVASAAFLVMLICACGGDLEYSFTPVVIGVFGALFIYFVCTQLAHKITKYLWKHGFLAKSRIVRSFNGRR